MSWAKRAGEHIAHYDKQLGPDATLKQRRALLREVACHFHGSTSWGQKVWGRECRKYLERHGQPKGYGRPAQKSETLPMFPEVVS